MFFSGQLMSTLGERIKAGRLAKKLKQEELGNIVGVGKSSVCQWEKGLTKNMDGINLVKTAIALGLNPIWLALEKGDKYLYQSRNPLQEEIDAILQGAIEAIEASGETFTPAELRRISRRLINYYFDAAEYDAQINPEKMQNIIKLSLL